jgi:hypothetical protein
VIHVHIAELQRNGRGDFGKVDGSAAEAFLSVPDKTSTRVLGRADTALWRKVSKARHQDLSIDRRCSDSEKRAARSARDGHPQRDYRAVLALPTSAPMEAASSSRRAGGVGLPGGQSAFEMMELVERMELHHNRSCLPG